MLLSMFLTTIDTRVLDLFSTAVTVHDYVSSLMNNRMSPTILSVVNNK